MIQIGIDVVDSDVPLLVSQQSLVRMKGILNFEQATLTIQDGITVQLGRTPSGHIMIPGIRFGRQCPHEAINHSHEVYAASLEAKATKLTIPQLKKLHLQLAH